VIVTVLAWVMKKVPPSGLKLGVATCCCGEGVAVTGGGVAVAGGGVGVAGGGVGVAGGGVGVCPGGGVGVGAPGSVIAVYWFNPLTA
jgi:hypothetical protein